MTGRIQAVTDHYRQQLLQNEAKAMQALNAAHKKTLQAIQPKLDALYDQISAKQQNGESIPVSWLCEKKRLESIKQLISGQIDNYAILAKMVSGQMQHQGIAVGTQSAQAQLQATVPAGVQWSFGMPSTKAIANMVGVTGDGSPLADLFNGFGSEAAQGASDALIQGVTIGQNPRVIASLVQQALDVSRWRALTISRTEMLRAYRSAALQNYKANDDVCDGWVWVCALDARSCAACVAMHGSIHSLDEELDGHPNCRCAKSVKTKSWNDILGDAGIDTSSISNTDVDIPSGSDWLDKQSEATQKSILGAKFEGWSNGDFALSDIVGHSHDASWGHSIYEKSLKALK